MMFCPIQFCPIEEEPSYPKNAAPSTPLVEKAKDADITPATEAMTPAENASTTPTAESSSISDDSLSTASETEKPSPIKPQTLVFEERSMEKIEEEKAKPATETTKKGFSIFKFIVLAMIYAFLAHSGSIYPKISASVDHAIETPTVGETTMEAAVDVDANVEIEETTGDDETEE